jgi:hypothetical protein
MDNEDEMDSVWVKYATQQRSVSLVRKVEGMRNAVDVDGYVIKGVEWILSSSDIMLCNG